MTRWAQPMPLGPFGDCTDEARMLKWLKELYFETVPALEARIKKLEEEANGRQVQPRRG